MPILVIIALSLHVLAAVFWTGTSFTLARLSGAGAERLFRPQMGAATVAVLTGAYLWSQLHAGGTGGAEKVLMLGAVCAVIAAGVQGALVGSTAGALRRGSIQPEPAARRMALAQRVAAPLLAVTLVCMVTARYV